MKRTVALVAVMLMAAPALADFASPGEPNGWDFNTLMSDMGGGIWAYTWTGFVDSDASTRFDILSVPGDWNSKVWGSGNEWVTQDPAGGNTLSLDTNTYADGWFPTVNRVGVAYEDTSIPWIATGSFQSEVGGSDWDPYSAVTQMGDMGGGLYMYEAANLPAGHYDWKAVLRVEGDGSWDSIGGNSRNVNSDNFGFDVTVDNPTARLWINAYEGTIKVDVVPEPATVCLLGLGALALLRRR